MRVCIVAGYGPSLINFRGALLRSLVDRGHEVYALAPAGDNSSALASQLSLLGVKFCPVPLARGSLNPLTDILALSYLFLFLGKIRPHCVLAYTLKPVVYTGLCVLVARFLWPENRLRFVALITGLGYVFTAGKSWGLRSFLRLIAKKLYRIGLLSSQAVVFQNPDDMSDFQAMRLLPVGTRVERIWGSGVELDRFPPEPLPQVPVFLMLARLLADKGVREYVHAARGVKRVHPSAVFRLAGMIDSNPAAISRRELDGWIAEGLIEYLGDLDSVQPALACCRFYVLPSYREGTPRSVLEAMATSRPIITTDAPGCRETVIDGVNGLLVPPRDSQELARAMMRLIEQPDMESQRMAQASLVLARERFDARNVNAQLLEVMGA